MINFNRSPESKGSGKNFEEKDELIENQADFISAFIEADKQLREIIGAFTEGKSFEEIKELGKQMTPFSVFLKHHHYYVSGNLLNREDEDSDMISKYDKLISELKELETPRQLKGIIKDAQELFIEVNSQKN